MRRSTAIISARCIWTCAQPSSPNTRQMRCSPLGSPSSTNWRTSQIEWERISSTFAAGSDLISELIRCGASVNVYDPVALEEARHRLAEDLSPDDYKRVHFSIERDAALCNADALVILTEWKEFRSPDFEKMQAELKHSVVFDG